MIVNFRVNNYKGIEKEANISSIASNKIKRSENECSFIDEKNKLLKTIGIIGCNGSGKTSMLSAISTLQTFLAFPYRKNLNNDEDFKALLDSMNEKQLKKYLYDLNTLNLGNQNINRKNEQTEIEIELYSPNRKDNIPGFYNYKIIYDNTHSKNGVLLEQLRFKEKLDSKKYITLCEKHNIIESYISTAVLYKNNDIKLENINFIEHYKTFVDEMLEYTECFFGGGSVSLREMINDNKDEFLRLCNIADDKIVDVSIDEDSEERNILFWNKSKNFLYFSQLSEGTRKTIILGTLLLQNLKSNSVSIIDELELSLHHSLAQFLIDLVSSNSNFNYSQLIFTTHSPLLAFSLNNDQLYFIHNHNDDYFFSNITNAIKSKIITKDQNVQKAWVENLLIKNPDRNKINNFLYKKD